MSHLAVSPASNRRCKRLGVVHQPTSHTTSVRLFHALAANCNRQAVSEPWRSPPRHRRVRTSFQPAPKLQPQGWACSHGGLILRIIPLGSFPAFQPPSGQSATRTGGKHHQSREAGSPDSLATSSQYMSRTQFESTVHFVLADLLWPPVCDSEPAQDRVGGPSSWVA